jgi:hypothetical protein
LLASVTCLRTKLGLRVALVCVLLAGFQPKLYAGAGGGTAVLGVTLDLSSSSVPAGTPVTLTATVTYIGLPVHPGNISFCHAAAAHCSAPDLLGTAQLKTAGAATGTKTLSCGVLHATHPDGHRQ